MMSFLATLRLPSAFTLLATLAIGTPLAAATLNADPRTLVQVFARAKSGDTIVLSTGEYAGVRLANRSFSPAVTLDARKGHFTGLKLLAVGGIDVRGGLFRLATPIVHPRTGQPAFGSAIRMDDVRDIKVFDASFEGPGGDQDGSPLGEGYGVFAQRASGIAVDSSDFSGFKTGIVLGRSLGFRVTRNRFAQMRSDGIQVSESRNGLIEANVCSGTRVRDKEHPDCIQLWSRPASPPTADVVIRGNRVNGWTQGIGLFNHKRDGVDDGGFDRILIENNHLIIGYAQGIALHSGRGSIVRNNKVETLPDAKFRASINLRGSEAQRCGNTVAAGAGKPAMIDEPCRSD